uniref:Uncharacterized protein n=1 Tax=Rhipicephalus zambeziensis TaxID=60191 RepID=A0A224Y851_9ACAR
MTHVAESDQFITHLRVLPTFHTCESATLSRREPPRKVLLLLSYNHPCKVLMQGQNEWQHCDFSYYRLHSWLSLSQVMHNPVLYCIIFILLISANSAHNKNVVKENTPLSATLLSILSRSERAVHTKESPILVFLFHATFDMSVITTTRN